MEGLKFKQKQYNLVSGTVDAARDAAGGAVSGVGSVLDSGGGKMIGGLGGSGLALSTLGVPAATIGGGAGAAAGAGLGLGIGSIFGPLGAAAGGALGTAVGGVAGGVGAAGLVAKGGKALGSSLTQATGEGLKGVGNAIKANKEFSSVLQKDFGESGPDVGDAVEVGMESGFGAQSVKALKTAKGLKDVTTGLAMPASTVLGLASKPVDKAKEIIGESIDEANSYRPTVKNSFVKEKNNSDTTTNQSFKDAGNTIGEGVEKAVKTVGNGAGGIAGGVAGVGIGAAGGAMAGKLAVGASNKFLGTTLKGGGKYGAMAGMIGGGLIGAQKGSSIFSNRVGSVLGERNYSFKFLKSRKQFSDRADLEGARTKLFALAPGELKKIGKGLWNVTKQHKGTIAEGVGMGAVMGVTGYAANRAIRKEKEERAEGKTPTMSAGTKMLLGAGATMGASILLKKGAHYGAFGKKLAEGTGRRIVKRANTAITGGVGFGAGIAALPYVMQKNQQEAIQRANGEPEQKRSNFENIGKKALIGAGLAFGGYKLAKGGYLGEGLGKKLTKSSNQFKESILKKVGGDKLVEGRAKSKALDEAAKNSEKTYDKLTWNKHDEPGKIQDRGGYLLNGVTGFLGGGHQKTQKLADQLIQQGNTQGSETLKKVGGFLQNNRKTAMVATFPLGYAATMGTWDVGEKAVTAPLKKIDPETYKDEENENI